MELPTEHTEDTEDTGQKEEKISFVPEDIMETGKIFISAKEKQGLQVLKKAIFDKYFSDYRRYRIRIPKELINPDSISKWAIVLSKSYQGSLLDIEILCSRENMIKFKEKYGGYVA